MWIVREKGFGELYRGLSATLITTGAANFIYFYMYNGFKNVVQIRTGRPTVGPLMNLVVATMASAINVTATNPLWVMCLKVKSDHESLFRGSMARCMRATVQASGVASLWKGLGPSLWLCSNPVVQVRSLLVTHGHIDPTPGASCVMPVCAAVVGPLQYFTYERLRILASVLHAKYAGGSPLRALDFFVIGALAKAAATVVTYPLQIAQSLVYKTGKSTLTCVGEVVSARGLFGIWRGMGAKLTRE